MTIIILSLFFSGCGNFRHSSEVHPGGNITPIGSISESAFESSMKAVSSVENTGEETYDILVLTGGGSRGAFAAGILNGWSKSGKRPEFDVVTGISTGALISVFAFLGKEHDPAIKENYTKTSTGDIFTPKYLSGLLFGNSLASLQPLQRRIDKTITPEILAQVAREHKRGRRLYVGTTNLDKGELVIWDMGAIAISADEQKLDQFKKVLITSASIPVWFPPIPYNLENDLNKKVEGDEKQNYIQLHADGGVAAPLFLSTKLFEIADSFPQTKNAKRRVFVIVSGKTDVGHGHPPSRATFRGIAAASIDTLYKQLLLRTIYSLYVVSKNAKADFHISWIPDEVPLSQDSVSFIPEEMQMLFNLGDKLMIKNEGWHKEPPRLTRYERIE